MTSQGGCSNGSWPGVEVNHKAALSNRYAAQGRWRGWGWIGSWRTEDGGLHTVHPEDFNAPDANFTAPDVTPFTRLDELVWRSPGNGWNPTVRRWPSGFLLGALLRPLPPKRSNDPSGPLNERPGVAHERGDNHPRLSERVNRPKTRARNQRPESDESARL